MCGPKKCDYDRWTRHSSRYTHSAMNIWIRRSVYSYFCFFVHFLLETLRLHHPAPVGMRVCTETYQIPGSSLTIRPGEQYSYSAIQKDEKYFPNPLEFDSERFSAGNVSKMNPYAYQPFGSGPRICINKDKVNFAYFDDKIYYFGWA